MKIVLIIISIIILLLEKKISKSKISPLFCLYIPILFNIIVAIISGNIERISIKYMYILLIIELIFTAVSISYNKFFIKIIKSNKIFYSKNTISILCKLSTLFICASTLYTIKKYGISNVKGNTNGILGHLNNIFIPFSVLLIFLQNKKERIILFLSIFLCLLFGGKYPMIMFLLPFIIYYLEKKNCKLIKVGILTLLLFFIFFYITYYINFYLKGINTDFKSFNIFIVNHFDKYLNGSFYLGNYFIEKNLQNKYGVEITYAPFINIYNTLLQKESLVSPILEFVDLEIVKTNVAGLIGELFYNIGSFSLYLYMFFLGNFVYYFDILSEKKSKWMITNLVIKSSLFLCFFNNVFTVFSYLEKIVGSILIIILLNIFKIKKSNKIN